MNDLMEGVRTALGGVWEGESVKGLCPVCSHERLYVLPPSGDAKPTFECGRGCRWSDLRPALVQVGIPADALRGRDAGRDEPAELPSILSLLETAPDLLNSGAHPAFRRFLLRDLGLSKRQVHEESIGLVAHGASHWLSLPVFDQQWVLRNVRYWNPFTGARFWPFPGNGGKWTLGVQHLDGVASDSPVMLCEGESDYLVARAAGVPAVAVLSGAGAMPDDLSWATGRKVVPCFDNDDVGRRGARKLARGLIEAGALVWIADISEKVPTDKGDLHDWLSGDGSPAALRSWMNDLTSGAPMALSELEATTDDSEALERERLRRRVRRTVDSEEALADWTPPPSHPHMGEEFDLADEPITWTVENLHERGTNTLVVAQYKTGKTVLALNLLKRLVDNEVFLGHKTVLPDDGRKVAWWNYELTAPQARRWVRELRVEHPERIAHLPLRGYAMPLGAERIVDWAVRWLRDHDVKVWVIDPFAEAFDGDENDNSVVRGWLQNVNEIKRRAEVEDVFLVVHTGHAEQEEGQERARGASRLEGWKDVGWYYTKHPDHGSLRFLRAFGRDVDVSNFAVTFDPVTRLLARDEATTGMSRAEVVAHNKAKRVWEVVAQHPGLTKSALRQKLGRGGNTEKDAWIELAVQQGYIRTEDGKQRAVHHYPIEQPTLVLDP